MIINMIYETQSLLSL